MAKSAVKAGPAKMASPSGGKGPLAGKKPAGYQGLMNRLTTGTPGPKKGR